MPLAFIFMLWEFDWLSVACLSPDGSNRSPLHMQMRLVSELEPEQHDSEGRETNIAIGDRD